MKVVFTTRLDPEFPIDYRITDNDTYLRILPFTVDQANKFLSSLNTELTY